MKRSKKFLAAALVMVVMVSGLILGACSSTPPDEAIKADLTSQLDLVKNRDDSIMDSLAADFEKGSGDLTQYGLTGEQCINALFDGFDYSINDIVVAEDGKSASAQVDITCKSFLSVAENAGELAEEWVAENMEEAAGMGMSDLNKKVGEFILLAAESAEPKTTSCTFDYEQTNGTWVIADSAEQEIASALLS